MAARIAVVVCEGPTCCERGGGRALRERVARSVRERGLADRVMVATEICFGHCQRAPNLLVCPLPDRADVPPTLRHIGVITPGAVVHHGVTETNVEELLSRCLVRTSS